MVEQNEPAAPAPQSPESGREALPWVECVPNFSEGRDPRVVEEIVASIAGVAGVRVLDYSLNADHNRAVVTFTGPPEAVAEAAFLGVRAAVERIDLRRHQGAHPRIGAADVVPFVPLQDAPQAMELCVQLARNLGQRLARELDLPVYLYEEAALLPERRRLETIRRGGFEGLITAIAEPGRRPDYGPARVHPTAGATVVGARWPLVAFNVNLRTDDLSVAQAVARAVRESSGGLMNVKAMGVRLAEGGLVQVSMNLTRPARTPIHRALELVRLEAARYGVDVAGSEIIGLTPLDALVDAACYYLGLRGFSRRQILETRLWEKE